LRVEEPLGDLLQQRLDRTARGQVQAHAVFVLCTTRTASLNSLMITVDGWALASSVPPRTSVRSVWCRTSAAQEKNKRIGLAKKVLSEVRSLARSVLISLMTFSSWPRAQYRSR
jgi:hypothetical protein